MKGANWSKRYPRLAAGSCRAAKWRAFGGKADIGADVRHVCF